MLPRNDGLVFRLEKVVTAVRYKIDNFTINFISYYITLFFNNDSRRREGETYTKCRGQLRQNKNLKIKENFYVPRTLVLNVFNIVSGNIEPVDRTGTCRIVPDRPVKPGDRSFVRPTYCLTSIQI